MENRVRVPYRARFRRRIAVKARHPYVIKIPLEHSIDRLTLSTPRQPTHPWIG
jgi:hypothetical protein